jgi:antitoxin VapB
MTLVPMTKNPPPADEQTVKHRRICDYLESHGLDAVLLSRRCNFSWYTCGAHNYVGMAVDVGNSSLLVTREKAVLLANNIETPRLCHEELAGKGIESREYSYYDTAARAKTFADATAGMKIACDAILPWLPAQPLAADFDRLRWTLTSEEIARYRKLCTDVAGAMEYVAKDIDPGQTEHEISGMLSGALRCVGSVPWVLLVGADDRLMRFRHPLPTDLVAEKAVMLAACSERGGLITACSRVVSFGKADAELRRKHQAVATVDTAMIRATRPGNTLASIYAEAQSAYEATGYADQWRLHHQGGSTGYLPREVLASPSETIEVLAAQAFAWNPSIAGTKSEDTILSGETGGEVLATPGDWPRVRAEWKDFSLDRPAILEK